jgi:LDH2 family malate/lactate/ureidoglycolate dehydrogenase
MAMRIDAFQPLAEFEVRMERLVAELKATPLAPGAQEIFYPGEIEARNDARHRAEGLDLPAATLDDLARVSRESGIAWEFAAV